MNDDKLDKLYANLRQSTAAPNVVPGADGPVFFRRPPSGTRVRRAVGRLRLEVLPRVGVRKVHPVLRERHNTRVGEHGPAEVR